ncbi:MAG: glutathione peroxidase [Nannocystaceae bacterium]
MHTRSHSAWLYASILCLCTSSLACSKAAPEQNSSHSRAAAEKAEAEAKSKAAAGDQNAARGVLIDHEVKDIEGKTVKLSDFRDKAVMIVNTASQCGFTPQYAKLQELYGKYKDKGLVVLGFPSNDYGGQEPGTNEEISQFVASKYSVEFPMMDKVATTGADIIPLYRALTTQSPEEMRGNVRWNFTKFLVDKEGYVVARYESPVDPLSDEVQSKIEEVLAASSDSEKK